RVLSGERLQQEIELRRAVVARDNDAARELGHDATFPDTSTFSEARERSARRLLRYAIGATSVPLISAMTIAIDRWFGRRAIARASSRRWCFRNHDIPTRSAGTS